jgi:hypothetical protein
MVASPAPSPVVNDSPVVVASVSVPFVAVSVTRTVPASGSDTVIGLPVAEEKTSAMS